TKNKKGKGPAWSNSLFENNAEFSYGMCLSVAQQRAAVRMDVEALSTMVEEKDAVGVAIAAWFDTYEDLDASAVASEQLIAVLTEGSFTGEAEKLVKAILKKKNHLSKKTMWMVGGDGWAYDIGYGGLDHVFAMGEDVNVLVIDTEVYSNTGGQSSKATPIGAVAQFQASGKKSKKKDLGLLMMSYSNVYVAQCAMGANSAQLMKAIKEAEAHKGPSIVIAYAPCITHGIKSGMNNAQEEMKRAVESGYWNLYRWNPDKKELSLDSKEPTLDFKTFLRGEVRYAALEKAFPENAKVLFEEAEKEAKEKYQYYKALAQKGEK
ncbi:MAG: thiamine pyrophosphate-dependent enzyme, partial [Anaerovoracaceae bacterium]